MALAPQMLYLDLCQILDKKFGRGLALSFHSSLPFLLKPHHRRQTITQPSLVRAERAAQQVRSSHYI